MLTSAEKQRLYVLADCVCRLTPQEQTNLWRKLHLWHEQFQRPGQEVLSSVAIPTKDSTIPKIEAPGTQEFLKLVVASGGGQVGFLNAVMQGALGKLLPEGQTIGGPAPAAAAKVEVKEEVKEEKTNFNLVIKSFTAESKLKLIKEVKTMLNIGLKEAKDQVESTLKAPLVLYKNIAKADAEARLKKLKDTGADVVME